MPTSNYPFNVSRTDVDAVYLKLSKLTSSPSYPYSITSAGNYVTYTGSACCDYDMNSRYLRHCSVTGKWILVEASDNANGPPTPLTELERKEMALTPSQREFLDIRLE